MTGERRMVTALYLDVVNSTGLTLRLGNETWGKLLNRAFDLCSSVIYHYEGTIAHIQDDELLAFFGAPVAHEDDPVRAARAALDILEAIRLFDQAMQQEYKEQFAVRLSLGTGPVMIGPVGGDLRFEYSALGGSLIQTAMVEAAHLPMTVLATEETHRFLLPFFECSDLGNIESRANTQPVRIFKVTGLKESPGSARGLAGLYSPMVGRQSELQNLLQLSQVAAVGLGRVVILLGEPGLGKTRLIAEWKAASRASSNQRNLNWVEARYLSYGQRIAYHLIHSLLSAIIGVRETSDEPEARAALCSLIESLWQEPGIRTQAEAVDVYPFLANLLSLKLDSDTQEQIRLLEPQALQSQTLSALRRLLVAMAAHQPVVVVLEDLHWADPSSIEFLTQLLQLTSTERILFCIVMRPERDAPAWQLVNASRDNLGNRLVELTLNTLTISESRQLISNLLEIPALPVRVHDLILKKSEGNPLFVEEVIRMLIDWKAIYHENGQWRATANIGEMEIPDNLQGLLTARIDRLPEEVKHTLRVAAVIGRQFSVKVLEQVLEKEEEDERTQPT